MAPEDDDSWPPGDIHTMLVEMRSNLASPHWGRVRLQVYSFARRCNEGAHAWLADADDITQEVMETIAKPGKLEAFGRTASADPLRPGEEPELRKAFLAWLATITRRRWMNRRRYFDARPDLTSRVSMPKGDEDDAPLEIPDTHANVTDIVDGKMLLESVIDFLKSLQRRDAESARKVAELMLVVTTNSSYEDVAERFQCKTTQVRDAVHSIRSQLRAHFGAQEGSADRTPDRSGGKEMKTPPARINPVTRARPPRKPAKGEMT